MRKHSATNHILYFPKKQRLAILVLIACIIASLAIPYFIAYSKKQGGANENDVATIAALQRLKEDTSSATYGTFTKPYGEYQKRYEKQYVVYEKETDGQMFEFDPNSIGIDDWQRLGVKAKTATGIINYRLKGGRFYKAEDIFKIWGLSEEKKHQLLPYVKIQPLAKKENIYPQSEKKTYEKKKIEPIDINLADTTTFTNLPGIGPAYARWIVNFRNRLGGFYSPLQIGETFNLPDSVFQKIKPYLSTSTEPVKKININTAPLEVLQKHPYIRYKYAKLIVAYREQHGAYPNVEAIKKIMPLKVEDYEKMKHYLVME